MLRLLRLSFSLAGLALLATACADSGWRRYADPHWLDRVETGAGFQHRVLFKPGLGDELHIYIEGDGSIWRDADSLFADPTPARPLTLQLMQRDPAPALFLGRPCYFATGDDQCAPHWWTSARYSQAVVTSMNTVAGRWAQSYQGIVLIGYSGGGTLAALMAASLSPRALVTLAGNLDTGAWTRHHHYHANVIGESLDPARQPPLPANIVQWHYAGADDDNVLWPWIEAFSARQAGAHFDRLEGFDHHCCWIQRWPSLLAPLAATAAARDAGLKTPGDNPPR